MAALLLLLLLLLLLVSGAGVVERSLMIFSSQPAHDTVAPTTMAAMISGRMVPFLMVTFVASFSQIQPVDGDVIKNPGCHAGPSFAAFFFDLPVPASFGGGGCRGIADRTMAYSTSYLKLTSAAIVF
jgi:hypothetical protein